MSYFPQGYGYVPPRAAAAPAAKPIEPPKEDALSHLVWGVADAALSGAAFYFSGISVLDPKAVTVLNGIGCCAGVKAAMHAKDLAEQAWVRFKEDVRNGYKKASDINPKWQLGIVGCLLGVPYAGLAGLVGGGLLGHFIGDTFGKPKSAPTPAMAAAADQEAFLNALLGSRAPGGRPSGLEDLLGLSSDGYGGMREPARFLDQEVIFNMAVGGETHTFHNIWSAVFCRIYPSKVNIYKAARTAEEAHRLRAQQQDAKPEGRINFATEMVRVLGLALLANNTLRETVLRLTDTDLRVINCQYSDLGISDMRAALVSIKNFYEATRIQQALDRRDSRAVVKELNQLR